MILVDGIPFDRVTHFDQSIGEGEDVAGGGRFSIFAPNLIQEADFLPGGFPAAYGGKNGSLLRLTVAEGNPVTEPFDDAEQSLEEKQGSRGKRRTRSAARKTSKPKGSGDDAQADDVDTQRGLF